MEESVLRDIVLYHWMINYSIWTPTLWESGERGPDGLEISPYPEIYILDQWVVQIDVNGWYL